MASGGKRGAGERVLESRHVIGLFMLMLLFSGVFFTLGYVMGRNQYDGQVRAATTSHGGTDEFIAKPNLLQQHTAKPVQEAQRATDTTPPRSDWEFYNAGKSKPPDDHLKPVAPAPPLKTVPVAVKGNTPSKQAAGKSMNAPLVPAGSYFLQVAALTKEADALDLAARLRKKNLPSFVLSPQTDKYYRVQVGPYADQKSAEAAKKGLEEAGFKAIVKH